MNRIDEKFAELRAKGQKALIPFITAGDPDLDVTRELALAAVSSGADLLELGIPFSDPVAEGPVIQKASLRALKSKTTLVKVFALVKELREQYRVKIPLLFMMYLNTIFRFGTERFFQLCLENGVDGVIVPDMPYEEREEIEPQARAAGIYSIRLVTPTSRQRIETIAKDSQGFLYCVSSLGVTGARSSFTTDFDSFFGDIRRYSPVPAAVGFGISSPAQARKMKSYCDGVIVGSAIMQLVEAHGRTCPGPVGDFIRELKDALRE